MGLNVMERCATIAEKALEQAKKKATEALNRIGEAELKLAEITSVPTTRDKEFTDYKGGEKAQKQHYYNKGFNNTEDSADPTIFHARKFGFLEGWMVAFNAIRLLEESSFRKTNQVPLPKDPTVGTQTEGQKEDSSDDDDEGNESPESQGLSWQIDFHVVVLDEEQPRTKAPASDRTTQPTVASDPQPINLPVAPDTSIMDPLATVILGAQIRR